MKKVDIRKIYVCQMAKQTEVESETKIIRHFGYPIEYKTNHIWDYEDDKRYGLFVQSRAGFKKVYKHILTDTVYFEADCTTGGHYVIIPESVERLTQKENELCSYLIRKRLSFNMDLDVISTIEERINNDAKYLAEDEYTASKEL